MKRYEIEQKYRVRDAAGMRKRLKALGARCVRQGKEWNEFWDRGKELSGQKKVLRLRRLGSKAWLTLKGRRIPGRYTRRLELETEVRYPETRAILRTLGYKKMRQYTKRREEYQLSSCLITLDFVSRFGWFLEIEASQSKAIQRMARLLKLGEKDREERSYLILTAPL